MKNKSNIERGLEFLIEGLSLVFVPPTIIYVLWKFMLVGYTPVPSLGYWQVFALVFIFRTLAVIVAQEFKGQSR